MADLSKGLQQHGHSLTCLPISHKDQLLGSPFKTAQGEVLEVDEIRHDLDPLGEFGDGGPQFRGKEVADCEESVSRCNGVHVPTPNPSVAQLPTDERGVLGDDQWPLELSGKGRRGIAVRVRGMGMDDARAVPEFGECDRGQAAEGLALEVAVSSGLESLAVRNRQSRNRDVDVRPESPSAEGEVAGGPGRAGDAHWCFAVQSSRAERRVRRQRIERDHHRADFAGSQ